MGQDDNIFEETLKNKLDSHRSEMNPAIWEGIMSRINEPVPPPDGGFFGRNRNAIVAGIIAFLVGASVAVLYMLKKEDTNQGMGDNPALQEQYDADTTSDESANESTSHTIDAANEFTPSDELRSTEMAQLTASKEHAAIQAKSAVNGGVKTQNAVLSSKTKQSSQVKGRANEVASQHVVEANQMSSGANRADKAEKNQERSNNEGNQNVASTPILIETASTVGISIPATETALRANDAMTQSRSSNQVEGEMVEDDNASSVVSLDAEIASNAEQSEAAPPGEEAVISSPFGTSKNEEAYTSSPTASEESGSLGSENFMVEEYVNPKPSSTQKQEGLSTDSVATASPADENLADGTSLVNEEGNTRRWSADILMGPSFSYRTFSAEDNLLVEHKNDNDSYLTSIAYSAQLNYSISPRLDTYIGASYLQFGERYAYSSAHASHSATNTYDYISIPVGFTFDLIQRKKMTFYSGLGAQMNFLRSGESSWLDPHSFDAQQHSNTDPSSPFAENTWGLTGEVGLRYTWSDRIDFVLSEQGILFQNSIYKEETGIDQREYLFRTSVGVRVKF